MFAISPHTSALVDQVFLDGGYFVASCTPSSAEFLLPCQELNRDTFDRIKASSILEVNRRHTDEILSEKVRSG